MDERRQGMWDKPCRLDGETAARLLTDYHGTQLLSDGFREFLQDEGYLEEGPEEGYCQSCPDCGQWRGCNDYGLYDWERNGINSVRERH